MTTEEELPKSIIVHIDRFSLSKDLQLDAFQEFKELCVASGTEVCAEITGKIDRPSPTYFVKRGKLEEIKKLVIKNKTNLVIFNNDLSPSQERNLEKYLGAKYFLNDFEKRRNEIFFSSKRVILSHPWFFNMNTYNI